MRYLRHDLRFSERWSPSRFRTYDTKLYYSSTGPGSDVCTTEVESYYYEYLKVVHVPVVQLYSRVRTTS